MTDAGPEVFLPIGEVLSLLTVDFPDITISKIRFLESQGLIAPERTASGYRRFHERDIETLRWVLTQQRDHFLPLKVIKARLMGGPDAALAQPSLFSSEAELSSAARAADSGVPGTAGSPVDSTVDSPTEPAPEQENDSAPAPVPATEPSEPGDNAAEDSKDPGAWLAALQEAPPTVARKMRRQAQQEAACVEAELDISGDPVPLSELGTQVGLSDENVADLVQFGLVIPYEEHGVSMVSAEGAAVAAAAGAFVSHGVEARHLRAYKLAAEREMGLFHQLADPLIRQRNPESRRQAEELVIELARAGAILRAALIAQLRG
jgi:DNA-binding transcriptional MerR regulator